MLINRPIAVLPETIHSPQYHAPRMQTNNKTPPKSPIELREIGQWWGTDPNKKKQIQIDLVGTPIAGRNYLIGSCNYQNEKVGMEELDLIRDYVSVFRPGCHFHYYIFSKGGFTESLLQAQARGVVRLVTLTDLYS